MLFGSIESRDTEYSGSIEYIAPAAAEAAVCEEIHVLSHNDLRKSVFRIYYAPKPVCVNDLREHVCKLTEIRRKICAKKLKDIT